MITNNNQVLKVLKPNKHASYRLSHCAQHLDANLCLRISGSGIRRALSQVFLSGPWSKSTTHQHAYWNFSRNLREVSIRGKCKHSFTWKLVFWETDCGRNLILEVPTCENMWGVLIFLRFYFVVGQAWILSPWYQLDQCKKLMHLLFRWICEAVFLQTKMKHCLVRLVTCPRPFQDSIVQTDFDNWSQLVSTKIAELVVSHADAHFLKAGILGALLCVLISFTAAFCTPGCPSWKCLHLMIDDSAQPFEWCWVSLSTRGHSHVPADSSYTGCQNSTDRVLLRIDPGHHLCLPLFHLEGWSAKVGLVLSINMEKIQHIQQFAAR